jgi:hypothetical protein
MSASATLVRPPASASAAATGVRRVRLSPATACFLLCLVLYLAVGTVVSVFFLQRVLGGGDGVSRVEIANRILFSRDPHLAAIGFLWGPIPELALIPLVALKPLWPALVTRALAGSIASAVFMAGASAALRGFLADLDIRRGLAWAITAAFALDPVIIMFASNGMSEAALLCFLLLTTRSLNRWLRTGSSPSLAATGIYLALAYLTRYEAAAAACAVVIVVMIASYVSSDGGRPLRLRRALLNASVAITPFAFAVLVWALICWMITGTPLAQISGVYGNASQNAAIGVTPPHSLAQLFTNIGQSLPTLLGMEPFLPVVLVAALLVVLRRRDWRAFGPPAVVGAVFLFMTFAYETRVFPPLIRYAIADIPFALVLTAVAFSPARPARARGLSAQRVSWNGIVRSVDVASMAAHRRPVFVPSMFTAAIVASVAVTLGLGLRTIVDVPDSTVDAAPVVHALVSWSPLPASANPYMVDSKIADYLDALHLPDGSVLMDDFLGYPIQILSSDPRQFVISSDRDFLQIVADPAANVLYVLVPPAKGLGSLDAINRAYPGAYATGRGVGTLVHTFNDASGDGMNWRLFRTSLVG